MIIFLSALCAYSAVASAGVKESFAAISKREKGPFGQNVLQGTSERYTINEGITPKNFLFQAAFRNEDARALAEQTGFYLGNLFSTNYYELQGEYVFNDIYGSHDVNHDALMAVGGNAIKKANLMVQHMVLEKHFISQNHGSKLSRSFKLRGIAGSEFEQAYSNHFFNFYLGAMDGDYQFLPAFLLANLSPIMSSNSLETARNLIAKAYDDFLLRFEKTDQRCKDMYKLRNAVHNQLSPAVIKDIDSFLAKYPFYTEEGNTELPEVKKILQNYYSFDAGKLAKQAAGLKFLTIQSAAEQISSSGANADNLLALSAAAADIRTEISNEAIVAKTKRAQTLALLANTSKFLNKEIQSQADVKNNKLAEAIVNTIYIEGFLIKDNWQYFAGEARNSTDLLSTLKDLIDISSSGVLEESFKPALSQWIEVDSNMQYFLDNTIKSSAISSASVTIEKLSR